MGKKAENPCMLCFHPPFFETLINNFYIHRLLYLKT